MLDVVLVRFVLPIAGIGFILWGFTGGGAGIAIVGAIGVLTSILFWRLPTNERP